VKASGLDQVRAEIGWAETGGRIIRDATSGDVVGRTKWIARSDFWRERPMRITEREAHAAIDKAQAGAVLSKREQRFVAYAWQVVRARFKVQFFAARAITREAILERRAIMREGAGL
jgi:hypothetical protein